MCDGIGTDRRCGSNEEKIAGSARPSTSKTQGTGAPLHLAGIDQENQWCAHVKQFCRGVRDQLTACVEGGISDLEEAE